MHMAGQQSGKPWNSPAHTCLPLMGSDGPLAANWQRIAFWQLANPERAGCGQKCPQPLRGKKNELCRQMTHTAP